MLPIIGRPNCSWREKIKIRQFTDRDYQRRYCCHATTFAIFSRWKRAGGMTLPSNFYFVSGFLLVATLAARLSRSSTLRTISISHSWNRHQSGDPSCWSAILMEMDSYPPGEAGLISLMILPLVSLAGISSVCWWGLGSLKVKGFEKCCQDDISDTMKLFSRSYSNPIRLSTGRSHQNQPALRR